MYLCIDTVSQTAGITLADKTSAFYLALDPYNSSEGIINIIDTALKKAGVVLSDLKGVYVIKGPGSFTGLRVGLTVANQFAHQLKIPITGLSQDEWWLMRTDEPNALYLQTMNKAEVYLSQNGEGSIQDAQSLTPFAPVHWLGQISEDHHSWLPSDFSEIQELLPIEKTWQKVIAKYADSESERRTYEAIEPFYGKDPNITKSKSQITLK
jgi:tRNA threonylcarbamoyl adenosine modification protein YeaZ